MLEIEALIPLRSSYFVPVHALSLPLFQLQLLDCLDIFNRVLQDTCHLVHGIRVIHKTKTISLPTLNSSAEVVKSAWFVMENVSVANVLSDYWVS